MMIEASKIATEGVEEYFFHFEADILSQKHQTDDLQGSETRKLSPLDVEIEQVGTLLLFLGICTDLFDSAVNQVLRVSVNGAKVFACHHLVILWNATISFFLIFQELFPK